MRDTEEVGRVDLVRLSKKGGGWTSGRSRATAGRLGMESMHTLGVAPVRLT